LQCCRFARTSDPLRLLLVGTTAQLGGQGSVDTVENWFLAGWVMSHRGDAASIAGRVELGHGALGQVAAFA
jgi:hypothetical protein